MKPGRHRALEVRPAVPPPDDTADAGSPLVPEARWGISHVDGVPWGDAPLPWYLHRCWAQTTGHAHGLRIERCACGAARLEGIDQWLGRNSRRRQVSR